MIKRIKAFLDVLFHTPNPLKLIWAQLLVKTGMNKYFSIQMHGYKLKFSRSSLAVTLFANNNDRNEDEELLVKILKKGDTYVDVGANIGTLVFTAAGSVSTTGKVIAIEAHPSTFENLKANVALNQFTNIKLIHSAAGNKKGSLFFSNMNSDDQNKVTLQGNNSIEVEVQTLDEMLEAETAITLLKIDVEGYEKFVLEGAAKTLQKTSIVLYESWDKHFSGFGYQAGAVIEILETLGFKVYKIDGNTMKQISVDYRSVNCENLLAVKDIVSFCSDHGFSI